MVCQHSILLFGHSLVVASASGLNVGHGNPQPGRHQSASQRGIRVAVHDDPIRALSQKHGLDALHCARQLFAMRTRANLQVAMRCWNSELLKDELRQFTIVMLSCVYDAMLDYRSTRRLVVSLNCPDQWRNFDELRSRANDADPCNCAFQI